MKARREVKELAHVLLLVSRMEKGKIYIYLAQLLSGRFKIATAATHKAPQVRSTVTGTVNT
jgi:hypothetical protein